jgi:ankyrin repeat protein
MSAVRWWTTFVALVVLTALSGLVFAQGRPADRTVSGTSNPDDAVSSAQAQLWQGATTGSVRDVTAALAARAVVDAPDSARMTALGIAALYGHLDVVRLVLAAGASPTLDQGGETPLTVAAHAGHAAIVDALVVAGASVNAKDRDGMAPLIAAAASNRTAAMAALLARGADVNITGAEGATPLLAAAFGGYREAAEVLLAAGARVDTADSDGRTPLMAAALAGSAPLVGALTQRNADVERPDASGFTALVYAAANGHASVVDALDRAGAKAGRDLALAFAIRGCATDIAQRFIDKGASTSTRLQEAPLLVVAAGGNCRDGVELLLAHGADVDATGTDGITALMEAARLGSVELASLLLDKGADLEKVNAERQSAWAIAALSNQRDVIEVFRKYRDAHQTGVR